MMYGNARHTPQDNTIKCPATSHPYHTFHPYHTCQHNMPNLQHRVARFPLRQTQRTGSACSHFVCSHFVCSHFRLRQIKGLEVPAQPGQILASHTPPRLASHTPHHRPKRTGSAPCMIHRCHPPDHVRLSSAAHGAMAVCMCGVAAHVRGVRFDIHV